MIGLMLKFIVYFIQIYSDFNNISSTSCLIIRRIENTLYFMQSLLKFKINNLINVKVDELT